MLIFRYIGKQIGRLLVRAGLIVGLESSDSNSFYDDSRYKWGGRTSQQPTTPNLMRNGSPGKIGGWKTPSSPSTDHPLSSVRAGAKYTEAEMQQALVSLISNIFCNLNSKFLSALGSRYWEPYPHPTPCLIHFWYKM